MMAAATAAAWCSWGTERISVKKVANHYPWDGKVDCVVTLSGTERGYLYDGVFELSVEKDGETVSRVVTKALGMVDGILTNTFDCTALFGAGYYPNGGISVKLVKKLDGVQLWAGGPYFASCNVGVTKPQEYGYYFWWGDTVGYKRNASNDSWDAVDGSETGHSFSTCPTNGKNINTLKSEGWIDANGNLVAAHDAARAYLGATWRLPTEAEFDKLASCTWARTDNWNGTGVAGYVVTCTQTGYTDKSIFLPCAGIGWYSSYNKGGIDFWASTPDSSLTSHAVRICYEGRVVRDTFYRCGGFSLRPVR